MFYLLEKGRFIEFLVNFMVDPCRFVGGIYGLDVFNFDASEAILGFVCGKA